MAGARESFLPHRQFALRRYIVGYQSFRVILKASNHATRGIIELGFFKRKAHAAQKALQISLDSVDALQNHLILLLELKIEIGIAIGIE
jgi:hypothetical protein